MGDMCAGSLAEDMSALAFESYRAHSTFSNPRFPRSGRSFGILSCLVGRRRFSNPVRGGQAASVTRPHADQDARSFTGVATDVTEATI